MRFYFNNCRSRKHAEIYGTDDAFYDLYLAGKQAEMAKDIQLGDECIVATALSKEEIEFGWFTFKEEKTMPMPDGKKGVMCRVFFGSHSKSEKLLKAKASRTEPYSVFFDKNGNFKRSCVILPKKWVA